MKIVIQCAARKDPNAGTLTDTQGTPVLFVANPDDLAPNSGACIYARPDDRAENGQTWREILVDYNHNDAKKNPLGLLPAYLLYRHPIYRQLVEHEHYGIENVFILSAGWGLIRSDFLIPKYDITFSTATAENYKKRSQQDRYDDFRMLPDDGDKIVFFGGRNYLPLFCNLTQKYQGGRFIYYNSNSQPNLPDCNLIRYHDPNNRRIRMNWHYQCATNFMNGTITLEEDDQN